ncbi:MAG: type 4b pilus protein PilO2 [Alphaproteobacteria bacterium]|nr:type 4b pilus protein PilO2 [Alphaproteobacteria bacterium]
MAGGIVTVGRRFYASGLYWENSPSGRVVQAAKEAARSPGAQFFAVRPSGKGGRVPQFGLSQDALDHKAGLPSLAACLANQQPGSWAGAFRLREGTAVVVVRDDLIVPDGDVFFLDETEARDRLHQEMALGGLQRVYAPETWGVVGADSMPLTLLLNDRSDVKLRGVSLSRGAVLLGGGGLAVLLILLGVGWYIQQENARQEADRLAQMEALKRAQVEAQGMIPGLAQKVEYPPPERVWEKKANPLELVAACQVALSQLPAVTAGWKLESVRCNEFSLSQSWIRTGGFSSPPPNSAVNDTGSAAGVSVSLQPLTPRGSENLKDPDEVVRRYLAQNWTGDVRRMADDPPPPPPPGFQGEWNPPPAPWVKSSFTVSTPVLPGLLTAFLTDLPGVVINSLALSAPGEANSAWTVDGVIYENRR